MTDLETVLIIALAVMVFLWNRQMYRIAHYRGIIIAVGLGHARVEIDDTDKVIRIVDIKKQQITNP